MNDEWADGGEIRCNSINLLTRFLAGAAEDKVLCVRGGRRASRLGSGGAKLLEVE